MAMRRRAARWMAGILFGLLGASCGGAETIEPKTTSMTISFQQHALGCRIDGLQARVEIFGVLSPCPLSVATNGSVSGRCAAVPTGLVRSFRLLYFMEWPTIDGSEEVPLATITVVVDLTNIKTRQISVAFPPEDLFTAYDNGGGMPNIQAVCSGRSPLGPG